MKIIHFLNHAHKANGHVELAVDLACEQAAQGHRVVFLSGPGDFGECLEQNGVQFVEFPEGSKLLRAPRMAWALLRACRRYRPDVVNAHMVAAALVARALKPILSYFLVTTVHNSFDRQSHLMGVGDRVITVSDAVHEEMRGKGIPAEKLRTVRNGTIGGRRRAFLPQEQAELKHPAVATVAGLHGRKGVDVVIDAFLIASQSVPAAHLYIVGEGPSRPELEKRASDGGGGNIHFLGHLQDPRTVLASAEIFVLASRAEPFGLVLLEARQMGCACIGTDVGGIPEVLEFGSAGRLVPPEDATALAQALSELLLDASSRDHLANAATEGLEAFTAERMAKETLSVYAEGRRRPHRPTNGGAHARLRH